MRGITGLVPGADPALGCQCLRSRVPTSLPLPASPSSVMLFGSSCAPRRGLSGPPTAPARPRSCSSGGRSDLMDPVFTVNAVTLPCAAAVTGRLSQRRQIKVNAEKHPKSQDAQLNAYSQAALGREIIQCSLCHFWLFINCEK